MDIERQNFIPELDAENKKFESFKAEFESLLKKKYGIDINDCTDERLLRQEFDTGSKPNEYVEFVAEKYNLDPLN